MKVSGIDGVLVDWYGMENFWDYGIINESTQSLFAAVQKAHILFGIVYEDQTVKHMVENGHLSAGNALNYGKSVMKYIQDNWSSTNAYLKLDNRPLVLTFGPQYFMQSSDWDTLFSGFTANPLFFTLDNQLAPVATGAYPWPPMWRSDGLGILSQDALNDYLNQFYLQAAGWPYLVTSAFTGFHDIYKEAGVGSSYGYLDRLDGHTFKSTMGLALSKNPDVVQVVTWNDYGEGTIIEPTAEFGYQYLEIVQSVRDSMDPAFQFRKEDLPLPLRVYNARRQFAGVPSVSSVLNRVFDLVIAEQPAEAQLLMDSLTNATGIRSALSAIPEEYFLGQNYPNPFNPSTTIRYGLPYRTFVMLTLYNQLGQKVADLLHTTQEAGYHEAKIDGSGLASGVYFYRLQAGRYVETKRLLLLR